jgi:DNA-binding NtrC family response regulator
MALILVVDDEQPIRQLLARAIKNAGHEVMEADSSDAALTVMEERAAGVVFTDIQMPGRDGRWLTNELRRRYPLTAVVLATSVKNIEPQVSLQWGVLSYLTKPFDLASLKNTLDIAVAWHKDAVANGPKDADFNDRLGDWLDSLDL